MNKAKKGIARRTECLEMATMGPGFPPPFCATVFYWPIFGHGKAPPKIRFVALMLRSAQVCSTFRLGRWLRSDDLVKFCNMLIA